MLILVQKQVHVLVNLTYNYIVTGCRCNGIIYAVLYGIYVLLYS